MTYRVRIRGFTYQERAYAIGEPWIPAGHPNDAAIIRARLVVEVPPAQETDVDLSIAEGDTARRVGRGKVRT